MRGLTASALGLVLGVWAGAGWAQTLDVRIYDSFGASYSSSSIGEDLGALYNIGFDPILVLIVAGDMGDQRLREQRDIVRALDPVETGVLYAIGTPSGASSRGYSLSGNAAADLLGDPDGFRVIVLNATGEIQVDSDGVVSTSDIIAETPPEE